MTEAAPSPANIIEVPVRTVTVTLPEEPIHLNGEAYTFSLDTERLSSVLGQSQKKSYRYGARQRLNEIRLTLGESLPPDIAAPEEDIPTSLLYDPEAKQINLVVPSHLGKADLPAQFLATAIERSVNGDLETALKQNYRYKEVVWMSSILRRAGALALVGAGEIGAMAVKTPKNFSEVLIHGVAGATAGGAGTLLIAVARDIYQEIRYGDESNAQLHTAWKMSYRPNKELDALFGGEPIITLGPVEPNPEPAP